MSAVVVTSGAPGASGAAYGGDSSSSSVPSVPMNQFLAFTKLVSKIANQTDATQVAYALIEHSSEVLRCDRVSFFFVDDDMLELVLAKKVDNIKLPKSKGLAGKCATTAKMVVVADAYDESIFDSTWDKKNNFRTKQVLCVPVMSNVEVIGVLQAINKKTDEPFNSVDQTLFQSLADQVSVSIKAAIQLKEAQQAKRQKESLVSYIKNMNENTNTSSMLFTLNQAATQLLEADRCTFYTVNHNENKLHLITTDSTIDITLNLNQGIAGSVATSEKTVNIPDCYQDSRFDPAFDKKTGYHTKSMLVMPVWAGLEEQRRGDKPMAVVQLINKNKGASAFQKDDEELLSVLLRFVGPLIKFSRLFDSARKAKIGDRQEVPSDIKPQMFRYPSRDNVLSPQNGNTIYEGNENDDPRGGASGGAGSGKAGPKTGKAGSGKAGKAGTGTGTGTGTARGAQVLHEDREIDDAKHDTDTKDDTGDS